MTTLTDTLIDIARAGAGQISPTRERPTIIDHIKAGGKVQLRCGVPVPNPEISSDPAYPISAALLAPPGLGLWAEDGSYFYDAAQPDYRDLIAAPPSFKSRALEALRAAVDDCVGENEMGLYRAISIIEEVEE